MILMEKKLRTVDLEQIRVFIVKTLLKIPVEERHEAETRITAKIIEVRGRPDDLLLESNDFIIAQKS